MKQILITGGFGFIGSHLVERLLEEPDTHVHVIDNLSTSSINTDKYVSQLTSSYRLSYDICSVEDYYHKIEQNDIKFDRIYHLASIVGPVGVLSHGGKMTLSIIGDTYRVIDLANRSGARLLDVSTSEVYGGGRNGYCSEKDSMIIPSDVTIRLEYAVSKLASEVAIINSCRTSNLNAVIVRPFNVAGPRQSGKGGFVLPRFIMQALQGEPLSVYFDGSAIRAFTHVKDIIEGLVLVMEEGETGTAYNIGNPANKTTILKLAEQVLKTTGSRSKIDFVDPRQLFGSLFAEANDKYPDADRAFALGWKPQYNTEDIIAHTADYIIKGRSD